MSDQSFQSGDGNVYHLANSRRPPDPPDMEALKLRMGSVEGSLEKLAGRVDKIDDRLRGVEIGIGRVEGKLDLLAGKIPSWWQQPVGLIAVIAAVGGVATLMERFGVIHLMNAAKP